MEADVSVGANLNADLVEATIADLQTVMCARHLMVRELTPQDRVHGHGPPLPGGSGRPACRRHY